MIAALCAAIHCLISSRMTAAFCPHREIDDDRGDDAERADDDEDGQGAQPPRRPSCRSARSPSRPQSSSARFFGLTAERIAPNPSDLPAVNVSIACIHLGIAASWPARGRRAPGARRQEHEQHTKRELDDADPRLRAAVGRLPSCRSRARAARRPAIVRPTIQPSANAGPFDRARGVPSMRTIAMIGTGLIATPTASGRISPIAAPTSALFHAGRVARTGRFRRERGRHCRYLLTMPELTITENGGRVRLNLGGIAQGEGSSLQEAADDLVWLDPSTRDGVPLERIQDVPEVLPTSR